MKKVTTNQTETTMNITTQTYKTQLKIKGVLAHNIVDTNSECEDTLYNALNTKFNRQLVQGYLAIIQDYFSNESFSRVTWTNESGNLVASRTIEFNFDVTNLDSPFGDIQKQLDELFNGLIIGNTVLEDCSVTLIGAQAVGEPITQEIEYEEEDGLVDLEIASGLGVQLPASQVPEALLTSGKFDNLSSNLVYSDDVNSCSLQGGVAT